MFDGDLELTIEEEEKIQNPANIYSLIRTLQFIEWAYNFSHIDRDTYVNETNIILEQYKNAVNAYPEYEGIDNFVKHYKLSDCTYAINRIKEGNEYDLILMDIMMPNMQGDVALEKLKENPNFNIPTIALTADAIAGAKEKYLEEGFVDYIAKPFSKDQIKEKLDIVFHDIISQNYNLSTPKYDPNVDRFKDSPAYVIGGDNNESI